MAKYVVNKLRASKMGPILNSSVIKGFQNHFLLFIYYANNLTFENSVFRAKIPLRGKALKI